MFVNRNTKISLFLVLVFQSISYKEGFNISACFVLNCVLYLLHFNFGIWMFLLYTSFIFIFTDSLTIYTFPYLHINLFYQTGSWIFSCWSCWLSLLKFPHERLFLFSEMIKHFKCASVIYCQAVYKTITVFKSSYKIYTRK